MKSPKAMSFDELVSLRETVEKLISSMGTKIRQELQQRLAGIDGLLTRRDAAPQGRGLALRGRKIRPKYRNPHQPSETWAGRGVMPRWMTALVKQGHKPEEFAIEKATSARKVKRRRAKKKR